MLASAGPFHRFPRSSRNLFPPSYPQRLDRMTSYLSGAPGSRQVQVTWINSAGQGTSLVAPIDNAEAPIWGDKVFGLSDLIFELAGVGPMRVRKNKSDPDAPLIPLSFRDLMWYCYLDQDELDSTFFHLEPEDPRRPKAGTLCDLFLVTIRNG